MKIFVHGKLPSYTDKQRWNKNKVVQEALKKKLAKFRARNMSYLERLRVC